MARRKQKDNSSVSRTVKRAQPQNQEKLLTSPRVLRSKRKKTVPSTAEGLTDEDSPNDLPASKRKKTGSNEVQEDSETELPTAIRRSGRHGKGSVHSHTVDVHVPILRAPPKSGRPITRKTGILQGATSKKKKSPAAQTLLVSQTNIPRQGLEGGQESSHGYSRRGSLEPEEADVDGDGNDTRPGSDADDVLMEEVQKGLLSEESESERQLFLQDSSEATRGVPSDVHPGTSHSEQIQYLDHLLVNLPDVGCVASPTSYFGSYICSSLQDWRVFFGADSMGEDFLDQRGFGGAFKQALKMAIGDRANAEKAANAYSKVGFERVRKIAQNSINEAQTADGSVFWATGGGLNCLPSAFTSAFKHCPVDKMNDPSLIQKCLIDVINMAKLTYERHGLVVPTLEPMTALEPTTAPEPMTVSIPDSTAIQVMPRIHDSPSAETYTAGSVLRDLSDRMNNVITRHSDLPSMDGHLSDFINLGSEADEDIYDDGDDALSNSDPISDVGTQQKPVKQRKTRSNHRSRKETTSAPVVHGDAPHTSDVGPDDMGTRAGRLSGAQKTLCEALYQQYYGMATQLAQKFNIKVSQVLAAGGSAALPVSRDENAWNAYLHTMKDKRPSDINTKEWVAYLSMQYKAIFQGLSDEEKDAKKAELCEMLRISKGDEGVARAAGGRRACLMQHEADKIKKQAMYLHDFCDIGIVAFIINEDFSDGYATDANCTITSSQELANALEPHRAQILQQLIRTVQKATVAQPDPLPDIEAHKKEALMTRDSARACISKYLKPILLPHGIGILHRRNQGDDNWRNPGKALGPKLMARKMALLDWPDDLRFVRPGDRYYDKECLISFINNSAFNPEIKTRLANWPLSDGETVDDTILVRNVSGDVLLRVRDLDESKGPKKSNRPPSRHGPPDAGGPDLRHGSQAPGTGRGDGSDLNGLPSRPNPLNTGLPTSRSRHRSQAEGTGGGNESDSDHSPSRHDQRDASRPESRPRSQAAGASTVGHLKSQHRSQTEGMGGEDESDSDHSPSRHNRPPSRHDRPPSRHDRPPSRHDHPPSRHDCPPSRHNHSPSRHNHSPSHHNRSPSRHDHSPSRHNRSPFRHDRSPSRHDHSPSRHNHAPSRHDRHNTSRPESRPRSQVEGTGRGNESDSDRPPSWHDRHDMSRPESRPRSRATGASKGDGNGSDTPSLSAWASPPSVSQLIGQEDRDSIQQIMRDLRNENRNLKGKNHEIKAKSTMVVSRANSVAPSGTGHRSTGSRVFSTSTAPIPPNINGQYVLSPIPSRPSSTHLNPPTFSSRVTPRPIEEHAVQRIPEDYRRINHPMLYEPRQPATDSNQETLRSSSYAPVNRDHPQARSDSHYGTGPSFGKPPLVNMPVNRYRRSEYSRAKSYLSPVPETARLHQIHRPYSPGRGPRDYDSYQHNTGFESLDRRIPSTSTRIPHNNSSLDNSDSHYWSQAPRDEQSQWVPHVPSEPRYFDAGAHNNRPHVHGIDFPISRPQSRNTDYGH